MGNCKICGNEEVTTKVVTEGGHGDREYCNECFISIIQVENLLHDHASRMFHSKAYSEKIEYSIDELNLIEVREDNIVLKTMMKFKGLKLYVHPRDPDLFPSNPHAHVYEKGWKINLYTGEIYDVRVKKITHKILPKELYRIVEHFKDRGIKFNE